MIIPDFILVAIRHPSALKLQIVSVLREMLTDDGYQLK